MSPDTLFAAVEARQVQDSPTWQRITGAHITPMDSVGAQRLTEVSEPTIRDRSAYYKAWAEEHTNKCPVCGAAIYFRSRTCMAHRKGVRP